MKNHKFWSFQIFRILCAPLPLVFLEMEDFSCCRQLQKHDFYHEISTYRICFHPGSFYTRAPRTGRVTWISKDWYVGGDTFSPGHHMALPLSHNKEKRNSSIWSLEKHGKTTNECNKNLNPVLQPWRVHGNITEISLNFVVRIAQENMWPGRFKTTYATVWSVQVQVQIELALTSARTDLAKLRLGSGEKPNEPEIVVANLKRSI